MSNKEPYKRYLKSNEKCGIKELLYDLELLCEEIPSLSQKQPTSLSIVKIDYSRAKELETIKPSKITIDLPPPTPKEVTKSFREFEKKAVKFLSQYKVNKIADIPDAKARDEYVDIAFLALAKLARNNMLKTAIDSNLFKIVDEYNPTLKGELLIHNLDNFFSNVKNINQSIKLIETPYFSSQLNSLDKFNIEPMAYFINAINNETVISQLGIARQDVDKITHSLLKNTTFKNNLLKWTNVETHTFGSAMIKSFDEIADVVQNTMEQRLKNSVKDIINSHEQSQQTNTPIIVATIKKSHEKNI